MARRLIKVMAALLAASGCGDSPPSDAGKFQVLAEVHGTDYDFVSELGALWGDEFIFSGYCMREPCRFSTAAGDSFTMNPDGLSDSFLGRLTTDGEMKWHATISGSEDEDWLRALDVSAQGVTAVTGAFGTSVQIVSADGSVSTHTNAHPKNALVAFFDQDGRELRAHVFAATEGSEGTSIAWVSDESIVVGINFSGVLELVPVGGPKFALTSRGKSDALIMKMSMEGEIGWWLQLGGIQRDFIHALEAFSDGSIKASLLHLATASLDRQGVPVAAYSSVDGEDSLALSLGSDGELGWSFSGANSLIAEFLEGEDGGFHAVGHYTYPAWLAGTDDQPVLFEPFGHPGSGDGFLSRYNRDGELEWVVSFGGFSQDSANNIERLPSGLLRVSGFGSLQEFSIPSMAIEEIRLDDGYVIDFDLEGSPVETAVLASSMVDAIRESIVLDSGDSILTFSYMDDITLSDLRGRRRTISCEGEKDGLILKRVE